MKVLKEITEWKVDYRQPNHTYLMDGDKVLAYKVYHDGELRKSNGMRFDKRYRKFKELPFNPTEWGVDEEQKTTVTVEGSKGNTYEVDVEAETCECPGFTFRGNCKHIEMAKSRLDLHA